MNKILGILGAGELGKQIANLAIQDKHYQSVVFFDDFKKDKHIVGTSDDLINAFSSGIYDELILGIGYNFLEQRASFHEKFKNKVPFGKIIHSSSWLDESVVVGSGSVIYPKCTLDKNVHIKESSIINLNSTISHDTIIDDCTFIAPSVSVGGFCIVGRKCFIGINSTIIDKLRITDNVKIGAGAVVTNNIFAPGLYVGIPAKFK
jgi:sugar O-acyltransferase (sialic acid O-acetyltransferase NeuD family)